MDAMPGDIIDVKVGRWKYKTIVEEDGHQYFVRNEAVARFVDGALNDYQEWIRNDKLGPMPSYTLNDLALDFAYGEIPLKEMVDLYTAIGYNVSRFRDVIDSWDVNLTIKNPLWEEETHD
jgi:hypothetical protein